MGPFSSTSLRFQLIPTLMAVLVSVTVVPLYATLRGWSSAMELEHLLVLCCYGGQPYLDFHPALRSMRQLDPTEWVAEDIAGSMLENSTLTIPGREAVRSAGLLLSACDLYNVTFLSSSDQTLFHKLRADLACRCPLGRDGDHCEFSAAVTAAAPQKLIQSVSNMPPMALVVAVIALALVVLAFAMLRGCFCDCFGPLSMSVRRGSEAYDKQLSPEDVEKCLQRVRAYNARRDMEESTGRPLITTISGSAGCHNGSAPYDGFVPPPSAPPIRCSSPPPAYSSLAGSQERISSLH